MKTVWIFGDSFAANKNAHSWTSLLSKYKNVINHASNGSSEHRIWKSYQNNKHLIAPTDSVLFCHTSTSRIYLKDSEPLLSRLLPSHPLCDIIFSDIYAKKENKFIKLIKKIWDDEYFEDTYNLLLSNLESIPNSKHITFFDSGMYNCIWKNNPGTINHMSAHGNSLVLEQILRILP